MAGAIQDQASNAVSTAGCGVQIQTCVASDVTTLLNWAVWVSHTRSTQLLFHCDGNIAATRIQEFLGILGSQAEMSAFAVTKKRYGAGLLH